MFFKQQHLLVFIVISIMSHTTVASTLLVMGDSLSAAYNLRPELGWVSLLQNDLFEENANITIVNASVSGETTQGGLSRFNALLNEHQPKWVIIELGANDALRGYPLDQTIQNLETMVEQAHQLQAKVLLIGNRIPQNYGKRYAESFYKLYENIATKYQLAYMPFMLKDVALNQNLMQQDGLHPNQQGQMVMLENILQYLKPLLEEKSGEP